MGRMVTVEEWAEIHGKTPAAVRRMIRKCVWKKAQNVLVDGKPQQRAAAQVALQYGWQHPLADPRSYNEKGERLQNVYNRKK